MSLQDKITSLVELSEKVDYDIRQVARNKLDHLVDGGNGGVAPFWAVREQARLDTGLYEVTKPLTGINKDHKIFAHISKLDKTKIAYTPDRASGEADRQIQSTIGRLFSKYYPLWRDEYISALAAEHAAEACAEITYIDGMAIAEAYKSFTSGVGGCMSGNSSSGISFLKWENHPAEVYDAPNIRLATYQQDGVIKARSLVYEASSTDRRYIRCYGSEVLKRLLERAGYVKGNLAGATLKKIQYGEIEGHYVIPYIDANNSVCTADGSEVVIAEGKLQVVTHELRKTLKLIDVKPYFAGNTAGYGRIPEITGDLLEFTCGLTGVTYSRLEWASRKAWLNGGLCEIKASLVDNLDYREHGVRLGWQMLRHFGSSVFAFKESAIEMTGRAYVNDPQNLLHYGFKKLSEVYYPGEPVWMKDAVDVGDGWVDPKDAVRIYTNAYSYTQVHKSKVTKDHTLCAPVYGEKVYTTDKSLVLRTKSGAKVIRHLHAICDTIHGDIDFAKNCQSKYIDGESLFFPRKGETTESIINSKAFQKFRTTLTTVSVAELAQIAANASGYSLWSTRYYTDDIVIPAIAHSRVLDNIGRLFSANPASKYMKILTTAMGYQESESSKPVRELVLMEMRARLAEMEAVEAPHYLVDIPVATVEITETQQTESTECL